MVVTRAESLPDLIERRRAELKRSSLKDLHRRLGRNAEQQLGYERFRLIAKGRTRRPKPDAIRALARILDVNENEIRHAIGVPPSHGPFELPPRANELNSHQRDAIIHVINEFVRTNRDISTED